MIQIDIDERISYDKQTRQFSAFDSDLMGASVSDKITLRNPKTKGKRTFTYTKKIIRGEEISGWLYTDFVDGLTLLIFND